MLRQHSLLLSLAITLFVSISSVWAKNVTVLTDDKRLTFSNVSTTLTEDWSFSDTGLCGDDGGISRTYTAGAFVRLRFNGTAAYVFLAECAIPAPSNVTIDDAHVTVEALNSTLSFSSNDCRTRTLFATGLTNTNHTITVAYAGTGSGQTVLNKIIYDDGGDTPKADPTATRATVTISDTGASSSATRAASASTDSPGCGTGCKTASISGVVGTIIAVLFWVWCFRACCCSRSRTEVVHTTVLVRPPSPKPQPIILLAATYEVQQTHIQVNRVDRDSAVVPSPPAYAAEQTNYK